MALYKFAFNFNLPPNLTAGYSPKYWSTSRSSHWPTDCLTDRVYTNHLIMSCSLPFYKLVVPTVDTVRYSYLVSSLVSSCYPVMLVGPVGTGKTSVAQGVLSKQDPTSYNVLTVNLSAQVSVSLLLIAIVGRLGSVVVRASDLWSIGSEFYCWPYAAGLVLGWVTICRRVNISVFNRSPRSTQPSIPPG